MTLRDRKENPIILLGNVLIKFLKRYFMKINLFALLVLTIALNSSSVLADPTIYPDSLVSCALFDKIDFKEEPFQEINFSALTVGDTGTNTIEPILSWDSNNRAYPFRYIRFRSAGYLIRGQRLYVPFANGDVFMRLAVYRSIANSDGQHALLKGIDLKTKKDPTTLEVQDPKFGVVIKCEVKNL